MNAITKVTMALGLTGITLFSCSPAYAQGAPVCLARENLVETLEGRYKESLFGIGISNGNLMELWTSPETGTFTVVLSAPNGISCALASGKGWEEAPESTPGELN